MQSKSIILQRKTSLFFFVTNENKKRKKKNSQQCYKNFSSRVFINVNGDDYYYYFLFLQHNNFTKSATFCKIKSASGIQCQSKVHFPFFFFFCFTAYKGIHLFHVFVAIKEKQTKDLKKGIRIVFITFKRALFSPF